jgi:hypothetical protein
MSTALAAAEEEAAWTRFVQDEIEAEKAKNEKKSIHDEDNASTVSDPALGPSTGIPEEAKPRKVNDPISSLFYRTYSLSSHRK